MSRRRSSVWASLFLLCLAASVIVPPSQAIAQPKSWLKILRELFGYNPLLAPGGSRGLSSLSLAAHRPTICLITPRLQGGNPVAAVLALPSPTLLSQGPLAEWALYDTQGNKLKGALARSDKPIEGEIAWPVAPLQPGQSLMLRLRPMQASGAEHVSITLVAASAAEQVQASQLLKDRRDRLKVVQELLGQGKRSLAMELAFAPLETPSPDLLELRRLLVATGCSAAAH